MPKYLLLSFMLLPLASLGQQRPAASAARPKPAVKSSARQKLSITTPCAVFYSPDDAWVRRHRDADAAAAEEVDSDIGYYLAQTRAYLRRRKIKTIDTDASTLRFVLANGSVKVVDLRNNPYGWGLLLFNGRTAPREADLVEPAAAVKVVFGK